MATKDKDTKTAFEKIQESRQAIVNEVVELLESGKKLDWSMGWSRQNLKPHNPVSGTQYQGGNRLRLAWAAIINEYQDPRWCTFNQAKAQGWQIKKGSKGVLCESFIFEREVKDLDENGNVKRDENGDIVYKTEKLEKPIRTTFTLFNASQIHGIPQLVAPTPQSKQVQLDVAKDFIASSDCPITYAAQERAFYSLGLDRITVPPKEFFKDEESFLATVTHEMGHSTGHKKRLDRDMSGDFGSMSYAKEELVAELCSMFTQSNLDIELKGEHFENHAAYLQSWISILKDDPNELFIAAEKASKAADYLYDRFIEYDNEKLKSAKEFGEPIYAYSGLTEDTPYFVEKMNEAMQERGYKHNIWGGLESFASLGGKIKDGEQPLRILNDDFDSRIYNIEQFEGVDLNLSDKIYHPKFEAYIQEHADELKNIHPNGLPITPLSSLAYDPSDHRFEQLQQVLKEKGYKHNIWVDEYDIKSLGGKIKDGEHPLVKSYYNIDQTEGLDLNKPWLTSSPYIKDYLFNKQLEANLDDHEHTDAETTAPIGVRKSTNAHKQEHEFTVGVNNNTNAIKRAAKTYDSFTNKSKGKQIEQGVPTNNDSHGYIGDPVNARTGKNVLGDNKRILDDAANRNQFKTNLWVTRIQARKLGGKIAPKAVGTSIFRYEEANDGNLMPIRYDVYNLDQTIGCDLSRSEDPSHPQIKAYIQAQSPQQNQTQQQAHESTSKQAPVLESFGNKELDDRVKKISEGFGFNITDKNEITAAIDSFKSFNAVVIKDTHEKLENKPDQERDAPTTRTKEHRNKDIER